MNVVFVSDDSIGIKLLESKLDKYALNSQGVISPNRQNSAPEISRVIVEQAGVTPDGLLALPDNKSFHVDIVVLDSAFTGKRTEKIIRDTTQRVPGVPVILLTDPSEEAVEVDAVNAGATDCIAKTDLYLNRLLPIIEREIARRKQTGEKTNSDTREDRLRQIVEKFPIGISVLAQDGTFLAINQAGLNTLGAAKLDQVVGKKIHHLADKEDQDKILTFLKKVGGGENDSLCLKWKGLEGKASEIKFEATPMHRQGVQGVAVLAAIYSPGEPVKTQNSIQEATADPVLKNTLQELKEQFQDLQIKHTYQKLESEATFRKLEIQCQEWEKKARATEEQQAALQTALDESEKNRKKQVEEYEAERARWEQARHEWEQGTRESQELQTGMQSTLQEAMKQLSAIETALRDSEESQKRQVEEHEGERARWEQTRREWEEKFREIEERHNTVQSLLQEDKEKKATLERALEEKEEQRASLEFALREAQENQNKTKDDLIADHSRLQKSRQELEQKVREGQEQREAVQSKLQETEEARAGLEMSLREAQENRNQQAEGFNAERSEWERTCQELDEKLREAEEKQAESIQTAVQEAETRYTLICEESRIKELRLEEIKKRMEQLKSEVEILQTALSNEKIKYHKLSRTSSVGTVVTTIEGQVLECNDFAARMFGYTGAEDALSQKDEENRFRIFSFQGTLAERLRREGELENIEWSSLGRDGRMIRLRENALLVDGPAEDSPAGESSRIERVLTDITRIYQLNEEIRRIRKVESTGDLLAAAVKNLKNICESLAESSRLLRDNHEDTGTVQQVAETLLKDANRGLKQVRQFLSVSSKSERIPTVANLNEILSDNDAVLRSLVGENIELQIKLTEGTSLITVDRQEAIRLISNLVVNSVKTLPLGGTISIETENIEIDASASSDHPEGIPSGTCVLMTIGADGCDVLPERRMEFNKSIVDRIGGWISTTSDPQSGNIHRVYFLRVEAFGGRTTVATHVSEPEGSVSYPCSAK